MQQLIRNRKCERGQTLLLVVVAMTVLLGMAALANGLSTLILPLSESAFAREPLISIMEEDYSHLDSRYGFN